MMKLFSAFLAIVTAFVTVGYGEDVTAPRSTSSNRVLNLVAQAPNRIVADLQALNRSGLVDLVKKHLQPDQKAKLDEFTTAIGVDPFTALSTIAVWGGEDFFDADKTPEKVNVVFVSDLESDAIDKIIAFLHQKAGGEKARKEKFPTVAILGKINKAGVVELSHKASKDIKEFPAEDGISMFQDDHGVMGVVDGEAVMASKTRDGVKTLWKSLQDASSTESGVMGAGEILSITLNPKKEDIVSLTGNVTSRDGALDIKFKITTLNPEKAQEIGGGVQMMAGFFTFSPKMDQKIKDLVKNLKVDYADNDVTISLNVPADALK